MRKQTENKVFLWNTNAPKDDQGHKDNYLETSRKILLQEMLMCNIKAVCPSVCADLCPAVMYLILFHMLDYIRVIELYWQNFVIWLILFCESYFFWICWMYNMKIQMPMHQACSFYLLIICASYAFGEKNNKFS